MTPEAVMSDDTGAPVKVLFAVSEAHPLVKTGGLADVGGALPRALGELGVDARLLLPAYPGLVEAAQAAPVTGEMWLLPGTPSAVLYQGRMPGRDTPVYLLRSPSLFEREGGIYTNPEGLDWPDNGLRFGLLGRAAALFGEGTGIGGWRADVVHANDWQTGLAPVYLAHHEGARARSVFSIHNIAFQGNFSSELVPLLGLPGTAYHTDGLEFHNRLSFMKGALYFTDRIATVSPTYAREIQTQEFGYGLEGLLKTRHADLTGILNGIDEEHWNPADDPHLAAAYTPARLAGKKKNKLALQERLGLDAVADTPVLGLVSRLTWQKGIDLILEVLPDLLEQERFQVAVLGSGDRQYEARLQALAEAFPERVAVVLGYDEPLSHLIEAGADLFLMPSRFEPCGLNQMYSMRYGTPPLVRRTGGLADSVVDATPATLSEGTATGFVMDDPSPAELRCALVRALLLYRERTTWAGLQRAGMSRDFSWRHSAAAYLALYRELVT